MFHSILDVFFVIGISRFISKQILKEMASKIPGFTSGLKPPTTSSQLPTLAKRQAAGLSGVIGAPTAEKRARTTADDGQGNLSSPYCSYHQCFVNM